MSEVVQENRELSVATKCVGFVVALLICFSAAGIGASVTSPNSEWFVGLNKPSWNPPNWLFGPVWTTLYFLMAVSVWRVWSVAGWPRGRAALSCFGVQIVLNVLWSVLFFGMQLPFAAAIEIVLLWLLIVMTMILFKRHCLWATMLLVPYLAWVSFATVLNMTYCYLNP